MFDVIWKIWHMNFIEVFANYIEAIFHIKLLYLF